MKSLLIKLLTLTAISTTGFSARAEKESGGGLKPAADWNQEKKILMLSGTVAADLFQALNAQERVDAKYERSPFVQKDHEMRIKENDFATCSALKKKIIVGGDAVSMEIVSADCWLIPPQGTVN